MSKIIRLFLVFLLCSIFIRSYGFFEITEVMPNTVDDKNLEYVSVYNNSDISQNLQGYYIEDTSWKTYIFEE